MKNHFYDSTAKRLRCVTISLPVYVHSNEDVFQSPMIGRVTYIRYTCSMRNKKDRQKVNWTIQIEILLQFNLPCFREYKHDSSSD